ncbi:aromatic acid exporter family protein [Paenibacillus thailandensis]|uniref:Aromatic acid exporter family protein n=1 Tax=Paenibacillus thailandensis TaxID=393250 RepID=A0ABW5R0S0_9BACL
MKIGFRTIKTAVGVSISVLLGELLQLQNYTAAGILTLLCIQKSRKKSVHAAVSRFFACIIGIFFAAVLFELLGYHPYAFLIVLLLFIPLTVKFKIQEGIASSVVMMMHVFLHKQMDAAFFLNELSLVLIGLGVALLVNWYMPSIDKELVRHMERSEQLLAAILHEISSYLKNGYTLWDGKEVLQLSETIAKGRSLAALNAENQTGGSGKADGYAAYFENKRLQYELVDRMLPMVSRITAKMEQSNRIGDFVEELSVNLRKGTATDRFYHELREIRDYHRSLPLPETREEFENRANLFTMANELERFINTI